MDSESRNAINAGPIVLVVGLVAAVGFAMAFPAVEGLGTKVRLPVFHGAMTWVNLGLFAILAVLAIAFLITGRQTLYGWVEATRFVSIPMWVVGSLLGFMAAMNTWDFTGSKSSPLTVAAADPRLSAQFWIMLAGLGVVALGLLVDERRWLAVTDVGFVAFAWVVLLRAILGPGSALHPDSPVLNSDEIFIKLMFFGIVAGIAVASAGLLMIVQRNRRRAHALHAAAVEAPASP